MWRPFNIIVSFKILRRNGSWTQAVFHCRATVRSVRGWKGLNTWCNRSCNSHMRFHMSYIYNVTLQATLKAYTSITVTPYLGLFINDYCISYCNIAELLFDRVYWRCWKGKIRYEICRKWHDERMGILCWDWGFANCDWEYQRATNGKSNMQGMGFNQRLYILENRENSDWNLLQNVTGK